MKEDPTINYAFALKHYSQNGRSRSMKKFCEEEGDVTMRSSCNIHAGARKIARPHGGRR